MKGVCNVSYICLKNCLDKVGHLTDHLEHRQKQLTVLYRDQAVAQVEMQKLDSTIREFKQSEYLSQYLVSELLKKVEVFNDGKVFGEFVMKA